MPVATKKESPGKAVSVKGRHKRKIGASIAPHSNPFDIVELIAKSPNVKAADNVLSAFYPTYNTKQKFEFLKEHFKFRIIYGSGGARSIHRYYSLVMQSILGKVRDFGIDFVRK